jgi:hypothetical protein
VTVTLAAISWLAVSNHCALGLAAIENHGTEAVAEQHDCCASDVPTTPRPAKNPATPCCKTLRATTASFAKTYQVQLTVLPKPTLEFIAVLVTEPPRLSLALHTLDTGPPGEQTFAESVLQRSLLAHAPPVLS